MFCTRKLNHISLTNGYGITKPCCIFDDNLCQSDLDNDIRFNNSFNDILKSNFRQYITTNSYGCEKCIDSEKIRNDSLRLRSNQINKKPINDVEEIEIALDFICNMRCLICRPGVSSRWNLEDNIIDELLLLDDQHYKNLNIKKYDKYVLNLLTKTNMKHLKRVRLVGGEPILSKNFEFFLNYIPPVDLSFNTNGSILPNFSALKRHKSVKIDVSLDAVDNLAEVIRYGSNFKQISKNIDILRENFDVEICCTLSILNVNKIKSLLDFTTNKNLKLNFILLYDPKFLSIYQFPIHIRRQWKIGHSEFDNFLSYKHQIDDQLKISKKFIDIMDKVNSTNFKYVNSEIYNLL